MPGQQKDSRSAKEWRNSGSLTGYLLFLRRDGDNPSFRPAAQTIGPGRLHSPGQRPNGQPDCGRAGGHGVRKYLTSDQALHS